MRGLLISRLVDPAMLSREESPPPDDPDPRDTTRSPELSDDLLTVALRAFFTGTEDPSEGPSLESVESVGRYRIVGEIARGGVGAVLRAHDGDIGREIAIKLLLDEHRDNSDMKRRLVEEAQIGGQLQHPAIVPVHELGLFGGDRPYLTMKLVKGETLSELLAARADPAEGRQRFLGIFEQVCQAIAYAHSRGVIHRDLKPLNLMVGAFGEVQVMDWGLAKVVGERADSSSEQHPGADTVVTVRREGASLSGTVMGTPAYMSPEQARGSIEDLDERTDVFSLGAILCEILTGETPYSGRTAQEVLSQAQRGDLEGALHSLEASGADDELVSLAGHCLAPERDQRPRDASQVVGAISGYLQSLEERAHRSELEAAEARVRAAAERKARTRTLAAGVVVVSLLAAFLVVFALRQLGNETRQLHDDSRDHLEKRLSSLENDLRELELPVLTQMEQAVPDEGTAPRRIAASSPLVDRVFLVDDGAIRWPPDATASADQAVVPWRNSTDSAVGRRLLDDAYQYLAAGRKDAAILAFEAIGASDVSYPAKAESALRLATLLGRHPERASEAVSRLDRIVETGQSDDSLHSSEVASWVRTAMFQKAGLLESQGESEESAHVLLDLLEEVTDPQEWPRRFAASELYLPSIRERFEDPARELSGEIRTRWEALRERAADQRAERAFRLQLEESWLPAIATLEFSPGRVVRHVYRRDGASFRLAAFREDRDARRIAGFLVNPERLQEFLERQLDDLGEKSTTQVRYGLVDADGRVVAGDDPPEATSDDVVDNVVSFRTSGDLRWTIWIDTSPRVEDLRARTTMIYGTVLGVLGLILCVLLLSFARSLSGGGRESRAPGEASKPK